MPPKTLTAEQVAEIDRQQKPAVNMRDVVPQREDILAARITAQERREAAPATLTPEQVDTTEAQTSVAAMTPFGRAMGAEPDRSAGPVFQPKKRLSATEVDQMQYEQISDPAYIPTKEEFQWYEGYKKTRDEKVSKFVQGAKGMAGGLVQAAAATAYAPFDFIVRGTQAYDEWVNSSAEGLRQTSIGLAELWSWGGDIYEDNQKELQRSRDLNNQIRQQLAAENKFTGNGQQDEQTLQQAIEQAKAGGLYEKTADDLNADDDTRYERFIRDRSFQQQAANITKTNIGTLPDSQREMGIDPSKVNPGLAFTAQLVFDPLNAVVPGGIGALSNLRLMRRAAALTGAPLKLSAQVAKAGADKVEDIYGGILSGIESRTGLNEAAVMGALNNPVTWRAVAAMGILKGTGKVLRKSENWLETGSIIAKEAGVGGVGVSRADAAARLRNAPIPERYRRAYDGFFTSADSTLRRVSETPGLSPIARRSAATLDRTGVTQAFRLADDAVSGAAAAAPIGIPFAAIAPEDRQPEILGAILSIGAAGGVVGGQARRMSEMNDALVAKMLADAEISGGDAVAMANMLSPEKLSDMARKQTMISAKADWVPLRAVDYELDKTVKAAVGNGTRGIHVEASPGKRPRVFLNLDKLASGDVAGHEIGHAIFMSDIMGGEIKQGMRAMVDVEYGAEGLAARGREYAAAMLTQEVNQGATGIKLEVLTPEEVNRKAAGVSDADLIRDRWSNDTAWRDSAINDRIDLMNQERMAKGGQQLDWARDEIAAETFSGLGKGVNLAGLRASGPLGRAVGAAQTALDMMGARFRGNGRLESPNKLFTENPLFDSPQMRKAVNDYVKIYDRYLVGLEKEGKVNQRGTPIAPTGRASDAARSPHTRLYPNKGVVESDLFVQRPDGTLELKSQQMINTQDKARSATLKSINSRDRLVPENSQEWGARRLSNGRVVVGGPTLPPQFDFFLQVPEWLRFKAREFEAGRNEGRSYLYSYNAIGTGADGSYKVKNLGNVEAKTGEAVPFGWDLSQKNHLLAKVIDLNSFRASSMRAIDNQLLGEFGNDLKAVEAGLKQLLKNYQDGVPGETNLGVTKKNILNGLLGTGTPTQRANNPAWHTLNNQGSIRTFRFDRLNYADPYGTGYFPHYDKLNINALPDNAGRMSLDEYMRFDADRQTAWLNNRARERGHSNSTNWANSDEAGFAAASEEYRQLFPRADAPMARGNAMPDVVPARTLDTDRLLREYEENQGYLGLSTMGMREGRPTKSGAAETRRLLARNTEISQELDARGVTREDPSMQKAMAARGQAMPDASVTQDGLVQAPEDAPTFKLPRQAMAQFMPDASIRLEDYADRPIVALPADRMGIGQMRVGPKGSEQILSVPGQGGAGFMEIYNGGGWAFTDTATADRFLGRLREVARPGDTSVVVGITALNEVNHLKNQTGQLAYVEALEAAIKNKSVSRKQADAHIREIARRIYTSEASPKALTQSTREKFKAMQGFDDFQKAVRAKSLNFADAAWLLKKMQQKALPLPYKDAQAIGIAFDDVARQTADPRYADVPFGTVVALLEVPINQSPSRNPFHYAYPAKVEGNRIGFLSKFQNIDDLTSDPRIRNKQGRVTAQPLQTVLPVMDRIGQRGQAMPDVADAPPFFLKSSQALDAKVQGRAATPDQVKAILTNPQNGIKAEELKWTGVMQEVERLAKENNGKVPKEALLRYLAEDGTVRLKEVVLPEDPKLTKEAQEDPYFDPAMYSDNVAKYGNYQLPGGENYREVVLAMPPIGGGQVVPHPEGRGFAIQYKDGSYEGGNTPTRWDSRGAAETTGMSFYKNAGGYTSSHFQDVPNYIAHMRLNERVDAKGKAGLFIEELQSDRHQQGREKGYRGDEAAMRELIRTQDDYEKTLVAKYGEAWRPKASTLEKAYWDELSGKIRDGEAGIPDAPFRTSWPLQLFKRALRDAVADGKEWIGWTTGDTQAGRYDLSKQVDSIFHSANGDGTFNIDVEKDGASVLAKQKQTPQQLAEIVGKEVAAKIERGEGSGVADVKKLSGNGLKVGGEGMKGFYDTMVPKDVAKYVKQWGAQVEKDRIGKPKQGTGRLAQDELPEVRSDARQLIRGDISVEEFNDNWGTSLTFDAVPGNDPGRMADGVLEVVSAVRQQRKSEAGGSFMAWRVNITPQMREGIKKAGQALFVGGAAAVVAEDQLEQ